MKNINKLLLLFFAITVLNSCKSDDDSIALPYDNGYFIINEGAFGSGIGTLSFVDDNGTISHDVYQTVNNEPMGNTLQSVYFHNDRAYLVLHGSHKIVVTNRYTMEKLAVIEGNGINNPRDFIAIGNKGYVTNWNDPAVPTDDFITVVDLTTNTVDNTISIGEGPEKLLINNTKLYVALKGGYNQNNKIIIIDTTNDTISNEITVGDAPNSMKIDDNGSIWVLCGGKPSYTGDETNGALVKIDNETIAATFDFETNEHPEFLAINLLTDDLYYNLDSKVFQKNTNSINTSTEITSYNGFYYGMSIKDSKLYTLNANDYISEGELKIFDLNTDSSETITTGIIPNSVIFQ